MTLKEINRELTGIEKIALVYLLCHRCYHNTRYYIMTIIKSKTLEELKKIIGSNFSNRLLLQDGKFRYIPFQNDVSEIRCIRNLLIKGE